MILGVPLLLLAAAAAEPKPVTEAFEMSIDGALIGTEEVKRVESDDGFSLAGKISIAVGGATIVMTQDAKLGKDGHPLSYALDVDAPGQQVTLATKRDESGYTLSLTPKGAAEPASSRAAPAKGTVFLIDNNFASHLDVLTRALVSLSAGEEKAFTALVPQVLQAVPATVKRGPDGKGTLEGAEVPTRSYRLVLANVVTELLARTSDGALMSAEVPLQRAVLKRRGFSTAPLKAAAVDGHPGETSLELAGLACALPATLLVPASEHPVPGVVFLSGSGPNDRDETIGQNKPFADLARGLGAHGIASIRFDKRTLAIKDKSTFSSVRLSDEYDDDAKVAIARLRAAPGVDPARVFVLGHSEGAMLAPRVAAATPEMRGIVMLAPGVRPVDVMIIDQLEQGARLMGRSNDEIAEQSADLKTTFAAIRDPERANTPPFMGAPAAYWRELMALDVPKMVAGSKLPILVLQGDEDIQVRKDADFELLKRRVGDTGGRVTYRSFPGLNHLFMKVEHGSTGAEYGIPGHVAQEVVDAIAGFILKP